VMEDRVQLHPYYFFDSSSLDLPHNAPYRAMKFLFELSFSSAFFKCMQVNSQYNITPSSKLLQHILLQWQQEPCVDHHQLPRLEEPLPGKSLLDDRSLVHVDGARLHPRPASYRWMLFGSFLL
jgi:hypothetical protein